MRSQARCTTCGCTTLLHATEILDRGESNTRNKMSLTKKGLLFGKPIGVFQAYVCTKCGLVEWYADVNGVEPDGKRLHLLEGANPKTDGPYR